MEVKNKVISSLLEYFLVNEVSKFKDFRIGDFLRFEFILIPRTLIVIVLLA